MIVYKMSLHVLVTSYNDSEVLHLLIYNKEANENSIVYCQNVFSICIYNYVYHHQMSLDFCCPFAIKSLSV